MCLRERVNVVFKCRFCLVLADLFLSTYKHTHTGCQTHMYLHTHTHTHTHTGIPTSFRHASTAPAELNEPVGVSRTSSWSRTLSGISRTASSKGVGVTSKGVGVTRTASSKSKCSVRSLLTLSWPLLSVLVTW